MKNLLAQPKSITKNIALAWYDRTQWQRVRETAADPQQLQDTFDAWEVEAVQFECTFLARGYDVRRVPIDAEALEAWCKAGKRPNDRNARANYATYLAEQGQVQTTSILVRT